MTDQTQLNWLMDEPAEGEPTQPLDEAPLAKAPSRFRLRRPRKLTVIVVVAVLILVSAGGVWVATGSSAAPYRWATVTKGDVDQTLNSYGTVTPLNQAVVEFPVAGTVATVPVKVGQQVTSGQTLATIEISSLQAKLDSARSTLATAQAKLVSDTQAQADGTTVASSSGGSGSTGTSGSLSPADVGAATPLAGRGSGGAGGSSANTTAAQGAVTVAQAKLLGDQQAVDNLLAAVAADLRSGTATCGTLISSLQNFKPAATPSATPSSPSTPATPTTGRSTPVPDTTACTALLTKVLADQQSVTTAQNTVNTDEKALTSTVSQLVAATQSAPISTPTPTPTPSPSTGTSRTGGTGSRTYSGSDGTGTDASGTSSGTSGRTSTGGSGGSGGGGTLVTAEMLVLDQATVDADTAGVTVAEQALKQATLVSPLAGTVAQISVKPGGTVSAQSPAVTVIGSGVDQVTTSVGDLDLEKVHVGADVTVTPDGNSKPMHGTVTAIGLLPTSTSTATSGAASSSTSSTTSTTTSATSSASYPVTISLDSGDLYSGSGADVSIVVTRSSNVVTVPTSAITTFGTLHSVTVSSGGKAVRKVVVIGASDSTRTQVTSGLKVGDHVALAKLNTPLPTSTATTITGRGGNFGGGGFAGGTGRAGGSGATRGTGTTRG